VGIRLAGKVVLITGASSGFGEAAARLFAREGCRVVLAARRVERLEALAAEIRVAGGEALPLPLDVAQQSQIDRLVRTVLKTYGRIDVLFNNAGFGRLDWLEQLDPRRDIDAQLDVNLRGVIQMTRAVLPHMLEQHSGQIINMSSIAGRIASPLYTIYAATKFGVRGFSRALRREVEPLGVRVSVIYPGSAATEFSQHVGGSSAKRRLKTPRRLAMSAENVAQRVVGLAKHPRRGLVIPGWYLPLIWIDALFPGLVDWFLKVFFVKRIHRTA
jgi:NADP-dependent 3-hydroxy acid dehydrogenase YdfG